MSVRAPLCSHPNVAAGISSQAESLREKGFCETLQTGKLLTASPVTPCGDGTPSRTGGTDSSSATRHSCGLQRGWGHRASLSHTLRQRALIRKAHFCF